MKKVLVISSVLFFSQFSFAQEKLEWLGVDDIWTAVGDFEAEGDYENALLEVEKIPKNDSSYYSSLTSRAFYLVNDERYEEAIKVADEGLQGKYQTFYYYFNINKISAYLGLEEYQKAITIIDEVLKVYPKNFKLYYNKGLAYAGLEEYAKAAKMYQQSIVYNPFYGNSHLNLAILCYDEHLITQTMMCLNMYLLISPDGDGSFDILNAYNNMVKSKNDEEKHPGVKISKDDDSFEEIDLIINNYAALNKKYKVKNKILLPIIKQNHVMISQLKNYEGNGDFWDTYYVPFYKWIDENELFNDFAYTIAYSVENVKYKAVISKNVSKIKAFIPRYQTEWFKIISINEELVAGKKTKVKYLYDGSKIQGYGVYKDEKTIGEWRVFTSKGALTSVGSFDDEGKKQGEWNWFNADGEVSETGNYEGGKLKGVYLSYHDNGKVYTESHYDDGKKNGEYKKYNKYGALIEKANYTDGEYDGAYVSYHALGEGFVEYEIPYVKGKIEGKVLLYYSDGKLKTEMNFKEGKKQGEYITYYRNGKIDTKKEYEDNLLTNDYVEYHFNGNLFKKGKCEEGDFIGEWKTHFNDNTLSAEMGYSKGKLDGIYKKYERDGKQHYEYTYKKGEIIAYKFYNKKGDMIKEAKKKGGEFFYEGHAPNGNITSEGIYDITGGKEGSWKFYTDNHVLTSEETLKETQLQGNDIAYYENGIVKSLTPYVNDTLEGYYSSFYLNKQMYQQGWYHKGELSGEWLTYYADGTLQEKNYYNTGELYGLAENYAVDGLLESTGFYFEGDLKTEYYYNPKGELVEEIDLDIDSANYSLENRYVNGEINSHYTIRYDIRHGKYFGNFFAGNLKAEGQYFNGEQHGVWKWYFENGQVDTEGSYIYGNKHGVWKGYNKEGVLIKEDNYEYGTKIGTEKRYSDKGVLTQTRAYVSGSLHGEINFYSEDNSHLQLTRYYEYGRLVGYSYLGKDGKKLPVVTITNETVKIEAFFDNGKPSRTMELENGNFINEYKEYYYSGNIYEDQMYKDGKREGPYKEYYEDGQLKAEAHYAMGNLNGDSKEYYPNGQLKEQTTYLNDEKNGASKFYSTTGKLIKEKTYFDNEVIAEKIYQ